MMLPKHLVIACCVSSAPLALPACAGMIAGSAAWFERQKPDVEELATEDLKCDAGSIEYEAVSMDDYRHVKATGCDNSAEYQLVKVGMFDKWVNASDDDS